MDDISSPDLKEDMEYVEVELSAALCAKLAQMQKPDITNQSEHQVQPKLMISNEQKTETETDSPSSKTPTLHRCIMNKKMRLKLPLHLNH